MRAIAAWMVMVLGLCPLAAWGKSSFEEVRRRIYEKPAQQLPEYPGLGAIEFTKAYLLSKGEIVTRSRATLREPADFKAAAPKLLHPRGVCAEATWHIEEGSPATGLFQKGTKVRAIVRFSSGTQQSRHEPGKKRILGMAVKLFPTRDIREAVETRNVFTLDRHGFEGSSRPSFFDEKPGEPLYFSNLAPPKSLVGKVANGFFGRFDLLPDRRPLYAPAGIDQTGKTLKPVTPDEVRFYPIRKTVPAGPVPADFREELLRYKAGEIAFKIVLPADSLLDWKTPKRIGTLVVGRPVVSAVCDLELHFHHHPNRR
jgi:hypothetical protein